ncbi:MAG: dockerin type I repeat-containing protein [Clostridia bacterium]|nr:dockerin type I repeat-containing protein [Clostridia bacterium]
MKKQLAFVLALLFLLLPLSASALTGENYAPFSAAGADFPTQEHIVGDANGDGRVDLRDAVATLRYLGGGTSNISRDAIDADGSGKVNLLDVILVLRYCVGDAVEDTNGTAFGALTE